MIHLINYASRRFLDAQRLQNASWSTLSGGRNVLLRSFSRDDVLPALRDLSLANEAEIREVLDQPRGDGLWAWKAVLMLHVYRHLAQEGDIVFYMDSGARPVLPFDELWERIRAHGHLFARVSAFESVPQVRRWLEGFPWMQTKLPLLDELDFSSRLWTKPFPEAPGRPRGLPPCILDRLAGGGGPLEEACDRLFLQEQVCGGFQGYLKQPEGDRILIDMLAATCLDYFDDVVRGHAPGRYIDHRHDQSMLSLIVNSECVNRPTFATCIVDRLPQVNLHRGYARETAGDD